MKQKQAMAGSKGVLMPQIGLHFCLFKRLLFSYPAMSRPTTNWQELGGFPNKAHLLQKVWLRPVQ
jgi:hypothetical protein